MRLEVDKQKFKQYLDQFIDDVPYEIELIETLLANIRPGARKILLEDLYFREVYRGKVYKLQHVTFKDDIHYFLNYDSLRSFLMERSYIEDDTYYSQLTESYIDRKIQNKEPVLGYTIEKWEIQDDR